MFYQDYKRVLQRAKPSGSHSEHGLTLIELMIAILVIGGLMALVVPSIQAVTGTRVRQEAGRLAGAIGYMYSHAAITGKTCRLVFSMDIDEGDGWAAECTEEAPRLDPDVLQVRRGTIDRGFQDDFRFSRSAREDDSLERRIKQRAQWNQFSSRTVQPVRLGSGIEIGGVWTPRVSETVVEGETYLYFFPTGETQRAMIYLMDPWENTYTLDIQPLTGRVRVINGWEEVPRGF